MNPFFKRTSLVFALALVPFVGCGSDDDKPDAGTCGDGKLDDGEQCDGNEFADDETCSSATMMMRPRGSLSCTESCTISVAGCMPPATGTGGTPGTGGNGMGGLGAMGGMAGTGGTDGGPDGATDAATDAPSTTPDAQTDSAAPPVDATTD